MKQSRDAQHRTQLVIRTWKIFHIWWLFFLSFHKERSVLGKTVQCTDMLIFTRMGYIICRASSCKMNTWGPLSKDYSEVQDGDRERQTKHVGSFWAQALHGHEENSFTWLLLKEKNALKRITSEWEGSGSICLRSISFEEQNLWKEVPFSSPAGSRRNIWHG